MDWQFKPLEIEDIEKIIPFFDMRHNMTCDSQFLDSFIWRKFYNVRYCIAEERALLYLMTMEGVNHSAMPMCREEDLGYFFDKMVEYFNQVLDEPFNIYLADEAAVNALHLDPDKWEIREQEDLKDYLYDAEALRTLSGKKLHKKKNNLNSFLKEYDGRCEYRTLECKDRQDVWQFLDCWRDGKGENAEEHLDYEVHGIHEILKNCGHFPVRMGGIYVDGKLEAFSIGSYNRMEKMAIIHIEKANPDIRGLYQYINQQFLIHEFPDAAIVNREDDLGLPGLRQAKLSYNPMGFARKYYIRQKNFGG